MIHVFFLPYMEARNLIHQKIRDYLKKENIHTLTPPQKKAIPHIIKGKNCLLVAPTGMGKTEAALLPLFHLFLEKPGEGIRILYITPLRALNRDMFQRTLEWGKKLGIDVALRHGDTSQRERRRQSRKPPDMLITTPETLQILFMGSRLRTHLKNVRHVIIDEIHELANNERGAQLSVSLERLAEISGDFQRIGLSATIGSPSIVANFLIGKGRNCKIIEVKYEKEMKIEVKFPTPQKKDYDIAKKLSLDLGSAAPIRKTKEIIEKNSASLVFVNTRDMGEILASRLFQLNTQVGIHHGSLSKNARIEAENRFKTGKTKALICTSSMELGIDVGKTDFVIQYNSPRQVTRLVQRIGRSGHSIGKVSKGAIIATNPEDFAEAIVIAKRALQGKLEAICIRKNPVTVLANQIISIAVEYTKISDTEMYEIITRAYPFWELPRKKFNELVIQLHQQGSIWYQQDIIRRKKKSMKYFLDNISMIPDERTITVFDSTSNKRIGTLDESFVLNYCSEGIRFIMKGIPWEVLEKSTDKIIVFPIKSMGIVPDWAGEDIPVPFEISREVGKLRRYLVNGKIPTGYPGKLGMNLLKDQVDEQRKKGFQVPTDKVITIESDNHNVIINTHFGSKTNETIGRILSALLSQKTGKNIAPNSNPYRIVLHSTRRINPRDLQDLFLHTDTETLPHILRIVLPNSSLIHWYLFRVARKFGAIEKDADGKTISFQGLIRIFRHLALFDEAIDKTLWDKMDIAHTREVWKKIQDGEIELVFQAIAPISLSGEEIKRSFLSPHYGEKTILETLKKRLGKTRLLMICTNCHHQWHSTVSRTRLQCPRCGGVMITGIKSIKEQKKFLTLMKKKVVEKGDKRGLKRFIKSASLVASYGRDALFVLAGYGIGPDTGARILSKQKKGDELLQEILEAEITYARTKRFWE